MLLASLVGFVALVVSTSEAKIWLDVFSVPRVFLRTADCGGFLKILPVGFFFGYFLPLLPCLLCGLGEASFLHKQLRWFCEFGGGVWGCDGVSLLRLCVRLLFHFLFRRFLTRGGGSCYLSSSRRAVLTRASRGSGFLCRKVFSVVFWGDGGHGVSSGYVLDASVSLFI